MLFNLKYFIYYKAKLKVLIFMLKTPYNSERPIYVFILVVLADVEGILRATQHCQSAWLGVILSKLTQLTCSSEQT